jgi:hypothetical protein
LKALFLITGTNETIKYAESLKSLGHQVRMARYDLPGLSDEMLYSQVKAEAPDLIVYIGSRWGQQPSAVALAQINAKVAPMVHICSDAADIPWHDALRIYSQASSFSLQVAIDGSHKWPGSAQGLTLLTPVDPKAFGDPLPHEQRNIICGYAGNPGAGTGKRTQMLSDLLERKVIDQLHIRSNLPHTNEMYNRFLGLCRMSVSIAHTGTEAAMHVKGRILESALAGALVLETKGSPTSYWFRPGLDYLEYESADEAADIVRRLTNDPAATQAMALSLRQRVLDEHTPEKFWAHIFEKLGMNATV